MKNAAAKNTEFLLSPVWAEGSYVCELSVQES
jgi:hypothetical protein